ncbi:MAG: hypothetical protein KAI81_09180, partial [Candidatus Marinimicrobia bacterium]|nr:hypothetical protein [Candidatus Neomarinimicrobiota bacterium]
MRRSFLIFISFLPLLLWANNTHSEKIILHNEKLIYNLKYRLITVDSLVFSSPKDSIAWVIDAARGRIILREKPIDTLKIFLYYHYQDQKIPERVHLGISDKALNNNVPNKNNYGFLDDPSNKESESKLRAKGSIARSIQMGRNTGNDIQSDMHLDISGTLAEGYEIRGTISDNNAASYDNVSSSNLKEIDNIHIEVNSQHSHLYFGDINVSSRYTSLNRYRKKLMGFSTIYESDDIKASAFAGAARGKFRRQTIQCNDGNQGPYSLTGEAVNSTVFIVPGSELVYLNGQLLEHNNYTIYYRDAEILISPSKMLSAESRLVVEFSYQDQLYPRGSIGGETELQRGKFTIRSGFFREKDDKENPADPIISRIDPEALFFPGDDQQKILALSTANEDSLGNYDYINKIWKYAGTGQGTHLVYFYREEQNGGYIRRYDEEGLSYFDYAPEDPGSTYYPRRWVEAANQLSTAHAAIRFSASETQFIEIEEIFSRADENLYTASGNKDGIYSSVNFQYSPLKMEKKFFIEGKYHYKGQNFSSFEPLYLPDFERKSGILDSRNLYSLGQYRLSSEGNKIRFKGEFSSYKSRTEQNRQRIFTHIGLQTFIPIQIEYAQLYNKEFLDYYDLKMNAILFDRPQFKLQSIYEEEYHTAVFANINPEWRRQLSQSLKIGKNTEIIYVYNENYDDNSGNFELFSKKNEFKINTQKQKGQYFKYLSLINFRHDERQEG